MIQNVKPTPCDAIYARANAPWNKLHSLSREVAHTLVEGLTIALIAAVVLGLSILLVLKVKAKTSTKIRLALARALVFSVIIYLPLIDQPRISGTIVLPIIGTIVLVFGIVLVVFASRELMKTELRGGKAGALPERIIKTGPYSIIRHPANLGLMSAFSGWYLACGGVYSLYILPILIAVFVVETFWEEKNLEEVFGDEYRQYKKKVGAFVPKIRREEERRLPVL
jgi:protein-S-isoprenylcysteine O-methyltransferase Ste14